MKRTKLGPTTLIFLGLLLGVAAGFLLKLVPSGTFKDAVLLDGLLRFLGSAFLNLIKMTVIPLVFASLVCGMSSFKDGERMGRVGLKVISFYLITTAVAVTLALLLGLLLNPGLGIDLSHLVQGEVSIPESRPIVDIFLDMIPVNPIEALATGNLLQVIVFAMVIGYAIQHLGGGADLARRLFEQINDIMMKVVGLVMKVAPLGVFALITTTVHSIGFSTLVGVAKYIGVVALAMLIHAFLVYGGLFKLFARLPLKPFYKAYLKVAGVCFSTSSSNAALPFSMEAMDDLGVERSVYSFSLPLGATINMDGTAIMQGVAVIFIAQVYGIDLGLPALLTVVLTAVLASVGTAGVPGVGMITLSMVLSSVNLPMEGIALIIGFDRILDMMRTTVNVMGDCACSVIVASSEDQVDLDKYRGRPA